jgi:hypothetical protein
MSLPAIPLATDTVMVAGVAVAIRALSRSEVRHLTTAFRGGEDRDVDAAEVYILATACDVELDEARAWRETTHADHVGRVLDAVFALSGLTRPKPAEGEKDADPQPDTSAP